MMATLLLSGVFWILAYCVTALNDRPIVGILAQDKDFYYIYGDSYLDSTYVSYLEMAGARVVPIRLKESIGYYTYIFHSINGLLFPGGRANTTDSEYAKAARILYDMALQANDDGDYFPIWGTCLGFEQLVTLTARRNVMANCHGTENISIPLQPLPGVRDSRMLRDLSSDLFVALTEWNLTANYHDYCLTPKNFTQNTHLRSFYRPLTLNQDINNQTFISTMEAFHYPIYATQWHPEKNIYLWDTTKIANHSLEGVQIAQFFANFFVGEARKSKHRFHSIRQEAASLIYNYYALYDGQPHFDRVYFFNYTTHRGHPDTTDQHPSEHHEGKSGGHSDHVAPQRPHRLHPHCLPIHEAHLCPTESTPTMPTSNITADNVPLILMGLGMVACLVVGLQLGRCLEAHNQSETWPDVLSWMIQNQRLARSNRRPTNERAPAGQRVRLLQTDKHYFTFENTDAEDSDV